MNLYRSVRAVTGASDAVGVVDWEGVAEAAKAATDAGDLSLTDAERAGYAADVRDARDRVRAATGVAFDLPDAVEIQDRHHWIDANVTTFRRVLGPLDDHGPAPALFAGPSRVVNTATLAVGLGFLARHVLGQYDPRPFGDGDHGLYVVHPNLVGSAATLGVERERFRRWIAFHEVAHAAEFAAAPWLADRVESLTERSVEALAEGQMDRAALAELDTTMTAVEGYAELVMDRAFDGETADLRARLDARRNAGGPVTRLLRRALGLGVKREQYERGARFFRAVADARGLEAASRVWDRPEHLPSDAELDDPAQWLARVS
ncbi:MAG: zinc-dependent metalloprotease [Haloferacaceae archaeon]